MYFAPLNARLGSTLKARQAFFSKNLWHGAVPGERADFAADESATSPAIRGPFRRSRSSLLQKHRPTVVLARN